MGVFERIFERLLEGNLIDRKQVFEPPLLPTDHPALDLVHDANYISNFVSGTLNMKDMRRIGFPWSKDLVDRTFSEVWGAILTAELALYRGISCNTAGGTHHAHASYGSGYCIVNDLAVCAAHLIDQHRVGRVMIIDTDVHQGDGTASIFKQNKSVFTLSIHCEDNFPSRKMESDLDIGLPAGTADNEYIRVLSEVVPSCLDSFRPDIVLYDAGVDTHVDDALGKLSLTNEGIFRREMMVLDACISRGIPVAGYVGGGYDQNLDILADRHIQLHRASIQVHEDHRLYSFRLLLPHRFYWGSPRVLIRPLVVFGPSFPPPHRFTYDSTMNRLVRHLPALATSIACVGGYAHTDPDVDTVEEPETGIRFVRASPLDTGCENCQLVGTAVRCMLGKCQWSFARTYAVGLYMEKDQSTMFWNDKEAGIGIDEETRKKILNSKEIDRQLILVMDRDVDGNHVMHGFEKSLKPRLKRCARGDAEKEAKEAARKFVKQFKDLQLQEGAQISFVWKPSGFLLTTLNGKLISSVKSQDLCQALFDIYLGPKSVFSKYKNTSFNYH